MTDMTGRMATYKGRRKRGLARLGLALVVASTLLASASSAWGQAPGGSVGAGQTSGTTSPAANGVALSAEHLVGKALFLRGFYAVNDLRYDAGGRVQGFPKTGEWTLAGVNVLKAQVLPGQIELDGVRVAIRYNAEQHQFERHPLNEEKMKILVAEAGDAKGFEAAMAAIFSVGIDPALQRSTPVYWQHYFNPGLEWPADALNGVTAYPSYGLPNQAKDVTPAIATKKVEAKFTSFAEHDRVKGPILLRMVVDADGVPQRIYVVQPLGYGLEQSAVEAMGKWRFTPGTREGKPVATGVVVSQDFEYAAPPKR
jgi:TonB family protein